MVAESSRVEQMLGWKPNHDDPEVICATAFKWEVKLKGTPPEQIKQFSR
jgi:UDP-glucose 4-epimerase